MVKGMNYYWALGRQASTLKYNLEANKLLDGEKYGMEAEAQKVLMVTLINTMSFK